LSDEEKKQLRQWARGRTTEVRLAQRAQIVLRAAEGAESKLIAQELAVTEGTVSRWRRRFEVKRCPGIEKDLPRGGRRPTKRRKLESEIIRKTTPETPDNATHWSTRTLAEALGTTQSMVQRVWQANGLKPHLVRTFKLSNDPLFEEKLVDVVGLYLNPPDNAMVFSVDEKSQVQALDRTQPSLPLVKGRCGTMTHDYKRNGTTTLFAAIDLRHGEVIARCMPRHRHQEWIKFLEHIDELTPKELDVHVVADNYATHKNAKVKAVAGASPALPHAFHAHELVLAERDRAVLPRSLGEATAAWVVPERRRPRRGHHGLRRSPQPGPQGCRLDRHSWVHPDEGRPCASRPR
jgi:transposase